MTHFPYATAAASLASDAARDLFARLSGQYVVEEPQRILALVEKRHSRRQRQPDAPAARERAA